MYFVVIIAVIIQTIIFKKISLKIGVIFDYIVTIVILLFGFNIVGKVERAKSQIGFVIFCLIWYFANAFGYLIKKKVEKRLIELTIVKEKIPLSSLSGLKIILKTYISKLTPTDGRIPISLLVLMRFSQKS